VVILRDIEGLTASEVAQVTGLKRGRGEEPLASRAQSLRTQFVGFVGGEEVALAQTQTVPTCSPCCPRSWKTRSALICAPRWSGMWTVARTAKGCGDSLKRTLALCKSAPSPLVPQHVQESLRKAVQAALNPVGLQGKTA